MVSKQSIVEWDIKFVDGGRCGENFVLAEVEFFPSIELIGADGVDLETLFMNVLVASDDYIYKGVGNCLVVKNGGRYHVFLAHMEYLGETGWNSEALDFQT